MPSCNREHSLEEQVVVGAAVGAGAWASDEQTEHDSCIKTLVCGSMIFLAATRQSSNTCESAPL